MAGNTWIMVDFGLRNLERIVACIGEDDRERRESLAASLAGIGLRDVRTFANLEGLLNDSGTADLLVLSESLGADLWPVVREIRHQRHTVNPFVAIVCVVAGANQALAREAVGAGADDVVAFPIQEEQLAQRLRRAMVQRAPFVVSSDYIGPERRARDRGPPIARIVVPNSIVAATDHRAGNPTDLQATISRAMGDVMQARLDAHGYRLGWLAHLREQDLFANARAVLSDAAGLAFTLKEPALGLMCGSLAAELGERMVRPGGAPELWRLIGSTAGCLRRGIPPEMAATDAAHGATAYRQRSRESFPAIMQIGPVAEIRSRAFPIIEIRRVRQGERLFGRDEPAQAGFLIVDGSVSLHRDRQGRQAPLAILRRGEVFGDIMARDGSLRRTTATAEEDSVLCVIRNAEESGYSVEPDVAEFLGMLGASLRLVHDVFTPKSRHVSDSVQQMMEQVAAIGDYINSPSAPAELKAEATTIAARLGELTGELIGLISTHPALDRRTRALPDAPDRQPRG